MDFTETPFAEDFLMELDRLVEQYENYGMAIKHIIMVMDMKKEDLLSELDSETDEDDE